MRFEEKCRCGAELILVFEAGRNRAAYSEHERDAGIAKKQIDTFRRRHAACIAPSKPTLEDKS